MRAFLVIFTFALLQMVRTDDMFIVCPNQCNCQQQSFASSSHSRWIDINVSEDHPFAHPEANVNSIMCIIQNEDSFRDIVPSIPSDVQALTFLFTGAFNPNVSELHVGDLTNFIDLVALEIRGVPAKLRIIMDAPLDRVLFVNFEAVELAADERTIRRPRSSFVDPAQSFSYMPNSEAALYQYNTIDLKMEEPEELDVVPYEQYKKAIKKTAKPTFYGWSSLLVLRLHNCRLDELEAEVFDDLGTLIHLSLEHNQIKVIPAFAFYGIPNLRTLSLAHNEILDLNYRDLAGLLSLRRLDLSYNNLTKLSELTFPPFPKLETVDLRFNAIRHIFAYTFDVMNNTRDLRLGDANVEIDFTQSENAFLSLTQLQSLEILNGSHPRFNERIFTGLANLRVLKMRGNFSELTFDSFGSVGNVTEMTLSQCGVEQLSMDTFYSTELLQVIDLSHNRIAYLPPNLFDRQFQLRELYLQNNRLAALPNSFFAHTRAKVVRLTGNPWICTCAMLKTWKQGVTNAKIKRKKVTHCNRNYNDVYTDEDQEEDAPLCKDTITYEAIYDNKLSPRCAGPEEVVKQRPVYYAYRRELKCKEIEEKEMANRSLTRSFVRNINGVGNVTLRLSQEAFLRNQNARKIAIVLAKKKQIEKKHFREINTINGKRFRKQHPLSRREKQEMEAKRRQMAKVNEEDSDEMSNQLEL